MRSSNQTPWHDAAFYNSRVETHFAAFYTDYRDYQSFQFNPAGTTIFNADRAHSWGAEMEMRWIATEGVELFAGAGFTKARFDDYQSSAGDFSGKRINNIPEFSANLGAAFRTSWGGVARLDWRHVGETWFDPGNTVRQGAYSLFDARIGYERENFGVYLFGRNLFDTGYYSNIYLFQGIPTATPGMPRMVGVELRAIY